MRVLIACEFSGIVRDAFAARGHNAWSCDLLPTESPRRGKHFIGDVRDIMDSEHWDLMIAHPPCQYLCLSGLHWNNRIEGRREKTDAALEFVRELLAAPIPKIALENPIGCISTHIRKPDQIIQPWQFGHPESKQTALWLKNLPKLISTDVLTPPVCKRMVGHVGTIKPAQAKTNWDRQRIAGGYVHVPIRELLTLWRHNGARKNEIASSRVSGNKII